MRTMWPEEPGPKYFRLVERIEVSAVPEAKTIRDPRVTSRFASFCRKYSIDELPQLAHVIAGQMSLVGPRPITAQEFLRRLEGR